MSPSCGGFSYHRAVAVASNDSSRFITEKKTSTDPIHLVFDTLKRVSGNFYGDPRSAAAATAGGAVTSSPTKETDLSCAHSDLDVLHRVDCIFSVLWLVSVFFSSPPRQVSGQNATQNILRTKCNSEHKMQHATKKKMQLATGRVTAIVV